MNKNIFVTYKSQEYPKEFLYCKDIIQNNNKGWKIKYYNDMNCRDFIEKEYPDFLDSFDTIKPGAYKADLFRCLIVHKYGGVYADIKIKILFDLDSYIGNREFFAFRESFNNGIWNGFFYAKKDHPMLLNIANVINHNIKTRTIPKRSLYYQSLLIFSGPQLWGIEWKKHHGLYNKKSYNNYSQFMGNIQDDELPYKVQFDSEKPLFFWRINILAKDEKGKLLLECDKNTKSSINTNKKDHYTTMFRKGDLFKHTKKSDMNFKFALERYPSIQDFFKMYVNKQSIEDIINGFYKEIILIVIVLVISIFIFLRVKNGM